MTTMTTTKQRPPARTIEMPCPHCGQPYVVVNGLWLAWLRERAGLSQRAFGRKVRATSPHLSDWERNRREVPERIVAAYRQLKAVR
jgi:DNA-binding transcriptional regulator YiaG